MSTYQTRETAVAVPYAFIEYMSLAMASPEAERIRAELFPSRSIPPLRISEIRAHEEIDARTHHVQTGVKATRCTLAGLRAEWMHTLGPEPVATFLYLHGGGFVGGCRAEHRLVAARLAAEANSRVLLPQYRLAPEHPYPAALEDARAVYYELLCQGVDPRKLLLIGDSAGGGLCAALLLALRDAGSEMPVAAILISPWLDLTFSGETYRTRALMDPIDRLPVLRQMAKLYLGGSDPADPFASPVFGDLRGFPRTLIHVGDHEVLLSDSTRFFERAKEMGVNIKLEVWPEMWHGWHMSAPELPEANEAIGDIAAFARSVTMELK